MCITRVAQVLSLNGGSAVVKYLDTQSLGQVDVSMVAAKRHSYIEVFAEQAIGLMSKKKAESRQSLMRELRSLGAGSR